jgi:DNA replication protein DnaC
MKYSELLQFQPIETVIQINEADDNNKARHLVKNFVVLRKVSEQLVNLIFAQLQFERSMDNKGILIIGNYGTGKSHLMSVISSIAEYPELYKELSDLHF